MLDRKKQANLGELLRLQRVSMHLTLQELASKSKVSASHLGRIENGTRYPSAHVLHRIAGPLGFEENELFTLAGYLSPTPSGVAENNGSYTGGHLDPYVARVLGQEPVEVQHAVLGILTLLKSVASGLNKSALPKE